MSRNALDKKLRVINYPPNDLRNQLGYQVYAFDFCIKSMQLLVGTAKGSTCPRAQRLEWPVVYLGDYGHAKLDATEEHPHFGNLDTAISIARSINKQLAIVNENGTLTRLAEYDLEQVLMVMFGKFGWWTSCIHPLDEMGEPPVHNTKPQPKRNKNRRTAKHSQLHKVERLEETGRNFQRSEPERVEQNKWKHRPASNVSSENEILVHDSDEFRDSAAENLMTAIFGQRMGQPDEYKIKDDLRKKKQEQNKKQKSKKTEKSQQRIQVGTTTPEKALKICRQVFSRYNIKPQCLSLGNTQTIFIPGDTDSKTRQLIKRFVQRRI